MIVALEEWYEFQKDSYSKLTYKDPRKFAYQNQYDYMNDGLLEAKLRH